MTEMNTDKPVLSDHIKQYIFLAFQTGGCLLLYESSVESTCMSFLHYFYTAISNHLSEKPKICIVDHGRLTQVCLYLHTQKVETANDINNKQLRYHNRSIAFERSVIDY